MLGRERKPHSSDIARLKFLSRNRGTPPSSMTAVSMPLRSSLAAPATDLGTVLLVTKKST